MKPDERAFEEHIATSLVERGGYRTVKFGNASRDFDATLGLDVLELFAFIEATQPDEWTRLMKLHAGEAKAKNRFADRLAKELDTRGAVDVLRHGVVDLGVKIRLAFFKPAHKLTPTLAARYDANRLTAARQLPFEKGSNKTLDLALFVNGIPVATAELKNALTGQNIEDAKRQYRRDRDPKNTTLARRAVVHFAADTEEVAMTTRLEGASTRFGLSCEPLLIHFCLFGMDASSVMMRRLERGMLVGGCADASRLSPLICKEDVLAENRRGPENGKMKAQVSQGLGEAREFAKSLDMDQVKSGEWFVKLLQKVVNAYDRNARAEYFQRKYPGLTPDEIADALISVTARYATVAGGVAGAVASKAQVATIATAGMTVPIFVGTIGSEMVYLARIQLRLILDLSVVYDLQLDPDDPEDILMVFGYAMGVAPVDLMGEAARRAAEQGSKAFVKKYVSKSNLKAVIKFAGKLGYSINQKTILKYAMPGVSVAIGSGYNYVSTRSLGGIAKAHFKNRRKYTTELQTLISRKNTYDLVFPAAAMYVANLDGELSPKEREFYKAMLSRMSFDDHTPEEFRRLLDDGENLIEVAAGIEDPAMRRSLMEVIVLMAVCDGELADEERAFLSEISARLDIPLDMDEVERGTEEYRITVKQNVLSRTATSFGGAAVAAGGRAAGLDGRMRGKLGGAFGRKKLPEEGETVMCGGCLEEISAAHKFCPECGHSAAEANGAMA